MACKVNYYVGCSLIYHCILPGPTHVLVVRGLDENADEEMLRYEFSKHAPIKVKIAYIFVEYFPAFNVCSKVVLTAIFRIFGLSETNLLMFQGDLHLCIFIRYVNLVVD